MFNKNNDLKFSDPMSGKELILNRKKLGLTEKTMAKILVTSLKEYKRYEIDGLRSPHDPEGPVIRLVQILTFIPKDEKVKAEAVKVRESLGYFGPEKKYKDVDLLFDLVKKSKKAAKKKRVNKKK